MGPSVSVYQIINPTCTSIEEYRDALVQQVMRGEEYARKIWYETFPGKHKKEKTNSKE